jgi:hypothetical protein
MKKEDKKMNLKRRYLLVIPLFLFIIVIFAKIPMYSEIYSTVYGKVLDDKTEKGIKGVEVKIFSGITSKSTITDEKGEFNFYEVKPGELRFAFFPPPPYAMPLLNDLYDVSKVERGKNLHIIKRLKCGGSLKGRIYDKNSNDIIRISHIGLLFHYPFWTEVNNNGEYCIEQIKPGIHTLIINPYGYGPREIENFEIKECEVTEFNFAFDYNSPTKIIGNISCEDSGIPITNFKVFLEYKEMELTSLTYSNENGNFIFRDVIPGNYEISMSGYIKNDPTATAQKELKRFKKNFEVFNGKTSIVNLDVKCPLEKYD